MQREILHGMMQGKDAGQDQEPRAQIRRGREKKKNGTDIIGDA